MKRGRKSGALIPGSRAWVISRLKPQECVFFPAGSGASRLMRQLGQDAKRAGAQISQEIYIAINPKTRRTVDMVCVIRNS